MLLCDLMMPDGDGIMLYEALSGLPVDMRSRVVFLTGGAFTPKAREFIQKHDIQLLDKPVFRNDLLSAMERVTP